VLDAGAGDLPLTDEPRPGPWGARVTAPATEDGLPAVFARLARLSGSGARVPALVAVHGGTPLTRTLVSEQARLEHRLPALLVDPGDLGDPDSPDEPDGRADRALTAVLSGRADLVGFPAPPRDDREAGP
jgi:anthraniloyl-CoA monooxygenase